MPGNMEQKQIIGNLNRMKINNLLADCICFQLQSQIQDNQNLDHVTKV